MEPSLDRNAQNFRGILNDLKRRPEDAASELGVSREEMDEFLRGGKPLSQEIIHKATQIWPLSPRDFYVLEDDCPTGVRIMRAEDSAKSSRVMTRAGKDYYEYRDTAMSSVAAFRPEWIKELCVVDNNDAENPAVQWNNGHFLHQFTYVVGPVNSYYCTSDGGKRVAVLNTGDSMYISPFVPHTFSSRRNNKDERGFILALTYGNKLSAETRQELSVLSRECVHELALDFSTRANAFASLLRLHREGLSMTRTELARRTGLSVENLQALEEGSELPEISKLECLADALGINVRDLLPPEGFGDSAKIQFYQESPRWLYPDCSGTYNLVELASTRHLPFSKALELTVLSDEDRAAPDLQTGLHQYLYSVGALPATIHWISNACHYQETLHAGDSLYIKPGVSHCFRGKGSQFLVLRIGGRISGDAQYELAAIGKKNLDRLCGEWTQWYDPQGRQTVT